MEKLKENIHILLLLNLMLTFFVLSMPKSDQELNFVNISTSDEVEPEIKLKKSICELGFKEYRDGKLSDYYFHPDVIEKLKMTSDSSFMLEEVEKFHFKMEGRDTCKVIGKVKDGFIAFVAIVNNDGPLIYRVTSISSNKPNYKDVKDYL